jgi:hypothetical protein
MMKIGQSFQAIQSENNQNEARVIFEAIFTSDHHGFQQFNALRAAYKSFKI